MTTNKTNIYRVATIIALILVINDFVFYVMFAAGQFWPIVQSSLIHKIGAIIFGLIFETGVFFVSRQIMIWILMPGDNV